MSYSWQRNKPLSESEIRSIVRDEQSKLSSPKISRSEFESAASKSYLSSLFGPRSILPQKITPVDLDSANPSDGTPLVYNADKDLVTFGPGMLVTVGSFTPSAGTGNKSVAGVGFMPKSVEFWFACPSSATTMSLGHGCMDYNGNQWWVAGAVTETGPAATRNSGTDGCLAANSTVSGTPVDKASFVSMDADGFTINFSLNSPLTWMYRAIG